MFLNSSKGQSYGTDQCQKQFMDQNLSGVNEMHFKYHHNIDVKASNLNAQKKLLKKHTYP